MNFKKIFLILLFLLTQNSNSFSIEPDVFVQSTVNRASALLSKNITKLEKINELKIIAKETVDIEAIGFYTLGNYRKDMNENQLSKYALLFEQYFLMFCTVTGLTLDLFVSFKIFLFAYLLNLINQKYYKFS